MLPGFATATVGSPEGERATLPAMALLTIREAAERTGHSTHKIRRLIKAVADNPQHADRSEVEPSPIDVERLNREGVQFTWRISEELVRRELGDAPAATTDEKPAAIGESSEVLGILQRAITAHEKAASQLVEQLKVKDDQIAALNDRLRESNLLMGSLQKQLAGSHGEAGRGVGSRGGTLLLAAHATRGRRPSHFAARRRNLAPNLKPSSTRRLTESSQRCPAEHRCRSDCLL